MMSVRLEQTFQGDMTFIHQFCCLLFYLSLGPIPTTANGLLENGCLIVNTSLTCKHIPTQIPNNVQEVFLKGINIEFELLEFDPDSWKSVRILEIEASGGVVFKEKEHQPVFKCCPNLRHLRINAKNLNRLDEESFLGLSNLETLDLSYSKSLRLDEVKKIFVLNTSVPKLKELKLGYINNSPVTLDRRFLDNLGERAVESIGVQGLALFKVSFESVQGLCNSLQTLNISNSMIFPNLDSEGNGQLPVCTSLSILDMSRTPTRHWAFTFLQSYKEQRNRKIVLDLGQLPSLKTVFADNLFFDIPGFAFKDDGVQYSCRRCRNVQNLKNLYIRNNSIRWLNASCDDCGKFHLELIDLSSNGLQYISPEFIQTVTTLKSINLSDNDLHVMQYYAEFENMFSTFNRLLQINMSKNKLSFLPRKIFENNIRLESIDLSYNKLTVLELPFQPLQKLRYLGLRSNALLVIDVENMAYFSTMIKETGAEFSLDLDGNTFQCDCKRSHFIKWLFVTMPRLPQMQCLLGDKVVTIDNGAVLKSQHLCDREAVVITSTVLSAICLLAFTTLTVLVKNFIKRKRREQKREHFIAKFKADRYKKYLVFVIFCQKEETLVRDTVIPALSESFQRILDTDMKLVCAGFTEYRLGLALIAETERCIRQSSVVIVLCSQASAQCVRCRREAKIAYEKDKPIGVVKKDGVNEVCQSPLLNAAVKNSVSISLVEAENYVYFGSSILKFCKTLLDIAAND